MMAAAEPSDTPEQSKMPSEPAISGLLQMVSFDTSLRNWARGLRAPFLWFFHAMRVSTSFISASSTPYFLAYAGARSENIAGAVRPAAGSSLGRAGPGRPENAGAFRV